MGMIKFNIGEGGLGRDLPTKDNYSGLLFDDATLPAGYTGGDTIKKVRTLKDAEDLGITVALFPVAHYQVSEFFRIAEKITGLAQGHLWIGFFDGGLASVNYDGTQLEAMQNAASGELRRVGVFLKGAFVSTFVSSTQTEANKLAVANKPLSVLLNADFSGTTLAVLADVRALESPRCSVNLGMDKGGTGGALFISESYSVTNLGAALASKAFGETHENIGWLGKFDQSSNDELNTIQFATGEAFEDQSQATLDDINTKGYLYLKKEIGITGTFQQDAPTATALTSDYAYWENQEVVDKAVRNVRVELLPLVNSPIYIATDTGNVSEASIEVFKTAAFKALDVLARDGNISTQENGELSPNSVIIDPNQDVLATSEIVVTIKIVPVGVARTITVNIGFTTQI